MSVRSAWLLPGGTGPGQTREDTRLAPLGTMLPDGELTTRSGVIPGGDPFAASGAGAMSLQIGIGRGQVQGTTAQGAYPVALDAPQTVSFGDGEALFGRIDTVVLRVYDQLFDVHGQNLAALEVVAGEATATPTAPTLEPACLPLWDVAISAGASAGVGGIDWNSALTDRRRDTVAVGGIVPRAMSSDPGGYDGQYADIGGTLYRWSTAANAWQVYRSPTVPTETRTTGATPAAGWSITYAARRRNGVVSFALFATRSGANIVAGSNLGDLAVATLPAGWRPGDDGCECLASTGYNDGAVYVNSAGLMTLRTWAPGTTLENGHNMRVSGTFVQ
ncbi:hypothetical protein OOK39_21765 [Streptomyces sp. NBC_00264]|uniref:hypothetical protein n=1 Tax=unclassified Streptomyces TaxID=2593676 RepID=UPI00225A567A|nr:MULTISPECIES: hypothetical protein [unclassified Streptomyces]MCX5161866.1 hypothetical protein [Streptomyces sp. NBC_00305]MCX5220389.1 hypothetical protein [Streptomyces sp. NBC_00264]